MGLDGVELVMEFEDEFDIKISDAEAQKMQTVGDTFDFIVKELKVRIVATTRAVCPSAHLFYEVRAGLQTALGVPPRRSASFRRGSERLIPEGSARFAWREFARVHRLPKPAFSLFPGRRFPPPSTTVGDLVRQAKPIAMLRDDGTLDTDKVWNKLREIVSEQLGVKLDKIQPHIHYINDLHCD